MKDIDSYKSILKTSIPELVSSYEIFNKAYQIIAFSQEFCFTSSVIQVTTDTVYFNLSIKRNGTLFGIVMEKGAQRPNPRQMKHMLSSTNFLLNPTLFIKITFEYPPQNRGKSCISKIGNFSNLYDDTEYDAYFIAENDLPVNPDLMKESSIQKITFKTEGEIFVIPDTYKASNAWKLGAWFMNAILVFVMMMILI